jgi:hypothetical protein
MKLRTVALSLAAVAAVGVAAVAGYWWHRGKLLGPSASHTGPAVPVAEYRLSGPYTHDNLTVFLVHGPETLDGKNFLTLQEALEQNKAVIHETESVNELSIENLAADQEVYVQSGDIIKGGKQDRTLPYDSLVGPKSGPVAINSFCVEQGRWSKRGGESDDQFHASTHNLQKPVLLTGESELSRRKSSQGGVWRNVARVQDRLSDKLDDSVKSKVSESSLQLTLESPAVRQAIAPYVRTLVPAPESHDDVIGYVAVINGRVLSGDVYASRSLFRKLWPKLLEGSAVEAFIEADPKRKFDPASELAVRAFLAEAEGGERRTEATTERTCTRRCGRQRRRCCSTHATAPVTTWYCTAASLPARRRSPNAEPPGSEDEFDVVHEVGEPGCALRHTSGTRSRLSFRTWTAKRTSCGSSLGRLAATRSIVSTSHNRPASSWPSTPGGTSTHRDQAAAVSATGYLKPASLAVADTSISTPSRIASARV